jgi:hypothetical protein
LSFEGIKIVLLLQHKLGGAQFPNINGRFILIHQ